MGSPYRRHHHHDHQFLTDEIVDENSPDHPMTTVGDDEDDDGRVRLSTLDPFFHHHEASDDTALLPGSNQLRQGSTIDPIHGRSHPGRLVLPLPLHGRPRTRASSKKTRCLHLLPFRETEPDDQARTSGRNERTK